MQYAQYRATNTNNQTIFASIRRSRQFFTAPTDQLVRTALGDARLVGCPVFYGRWCAQTSLWLKGRQVEGLTRKANM